MVRGTVDRGLKFQIQKETEALDGPVPAGASPTRLRVTVPDRIGKLRWIKLRYRSSFFDDPVRPLIGFVDLNGREVVYAMNGPVLGTGEWIGRVPDGTMSVFIVPTKHRDETSFEILSIESVSRLELVRRGLSFDRDAIMWSLGAKFIGAKEERWETLKFAATPSPIKNYAEWHRKLHRPLDINSIDRPRLDWNSGPAFRFILPLEQGSAQGLRATLDSLRSQKYQRWRVEGVTSTRTPPDLLRAFQAETEGDPRFRERLALASMFDGGGFAKEHVALIDVGDTLADYATAVVAEAVARDPKLSVIYSDEDAMSDNAELHSPLFKPDWSPTFFSGKNYLGRLTCLDSGSLRAVGIQSVGEFIEDESSILFNVCLNAADSDILHLRRVLYRRRKDRIEDAPLVVQPGHVANSIL